MKSTALILVFLLSLAAPSSGLEADSESASYSVFNLRFEGPAGMDMVDISAGNGEIIEFRFDTDTTPGECLIHLDFYLFPPTALKDMGGIAGLMQYGKSTILATAKPAEKTVTRKIFGKKIKGEVLKMKIPIPSYAEAYIIPLKGTKQYLFLGIKADATAVPEAIEEIIAQVTTTLQKQ